jgi:hypothetical protein
MATRRRITSFVVLVVALSAGMLVPVERRASAITTRRAASGASRGFTLYSPLQGNCTYLVNRGGDVVHEWWSTTKPGNNQHLLPNGNLLRAGELAGKEHLFSPYGYGGLIEEVKWNSDPVWKLKYADRSHMQHHDVTPLPNGNVLFLAWQRKSGAQAIATGRNPATLADGELWPDSVVEYNPRQQPRPRSDLGQLTRAQRGLDHRPPHDHPTGTQSRP